MSRITRGYGFAYFRWICGHWRLADAVRCKDYVFYDLFADVQSGYVLKGYR